MNIDFLVKNLKEWQDFAGAVIGAGIPISFWFFKEWRQRKKKLKQNLDSVEKMLVYELNKVISARQTLKKFLDVQLADLKKSTEEYQKLGKYSLGVTFIPLFSVDPIEENLLQLEIESGYLANKITQIYAMSKDFSLMIDDLREQFKEMIRTNKEISMGKLNEPKAQNAFFLKNIEGFEKMMAEDIFGKNIPIYIRILVITRTVTTTIRKIGMLRWKSRFAPHFKYFKNKHALIDFYKNTFDRMEAFFQEEINQQIKEIENKFA